MEVKVVPRKGSRLVVTPERKKRFLDRVGKKASDIGRPGFAFVDRVTGLSLIEPASKQK